MACLMVSLLPAGIDVQGADATEAPRISQQEFKKLVAANDVVIVDTRNVDAFEESHMRGALLLPLEGQPTWPDAYEKTVAILQKTRKPVVVYCA